MKNLLIYPEIFYNKTTKKVLKEMSTDKNVTLSDLLSLAWEQSTKGIKDNIASNIQFLTDLSFVSWFDFVFTFLLSFGFLYKAIVCFKKEVNYQQRNTKYHDE